MCLHVGVCVCLHVGVCVCVSTCWCVCVCVCVCQRAAVDDLSISLRDYVEADFRTGKLSFIFVLAHQQVCLQISAGVFLGVLNTLDAC